MRNAHAVWPVADASDWPGDEADDSMDLEGLRERVSAATGAERVLAAPRTPSRDEPKEHDVSHVPHRPRCRFCVMVWRDDT